ncbi:MAG: xanthine dehydrogenase family protein subunit M [Deferrisomatales bacterium]|nr:xanthine dehydrogenase family protein subunit M [Deferrisomatales bacterium]
MRIDPLEYLRPGTRGEALALLAEHGAEARVLGGGTDLVARMKLGIVSPKVAVDLGDIAELRGIREDAEGLTIGAGTPLHAVAQSPAVVSRYPSLATAAASVASFQIRNRGTLAGNVCLETMCWFYNQSRQWKKSRPLCHKAGGEPCHVVNQPSVCYATYRGDTAVALMALGAQAEVQSQGQERRLPLEELFTGEGKSPLALAATEMITAFRIPAPPVASGNAYRKVSHRQAVDYPQAGVAAAVVLAPGGGTCVAARIVLGAVGPCPVRAREAEALLQGQEITGEVLERAAQAAVAVARPVNNMTFGAPSYRRKMVRVLGLKALVAAVEQARQGHSQGDDR